MRPRPGSLFYFAPRSLPRSRYVFVGATGIHEMMPRGYIRHGGPAWPHYLLMQFFSPALVKTADADATVAGHTILWKPFSNHFYGSPWGNWDHSWLNICGSALDEIVMEERIPLDTPLALSFADVFERYSRMLYDELHSRSRQDGVMIGSVMRMWLHELGMANRATGQGGIPDPLMRARQHIESHYKEKLTLADLTGAANLSASQLSLLFRRHYGLPPMEYLITFRLRRAELLLGNDYFTIAEIADRAGFSDPLYFSRQFRNRNGMSPSEFRKRSSASPPIENPRNFS